MRCNRGAIARASLDRCTGHRVDTATLRRREWRVWWCWRFIRGVVARGAARIGSVAPERPTHVQKTHHVAISAVTAVGASVRHCCAVTDSNTPCEAGLDVRQTYALNHPGVRGRCNRSTVGGSSLTILTGQWNDGRVGRLRLRRNLGWWRRG